jgi:hypothetical protein
MRVLSLATFKQLMSAISHACRTPGDEKSKCVRVCERVCMCECEYMYVCVCINVMVCG